jgi:negative regulator of flagellin synthesis FlgM
VKIENSSVKSIGELASGETRARAPKTPAQSEAGVVQFSAAPGRFHEIEAMLANLPVADPARIAEIKQAIAEGRFQVDAEKVADRLIESVRELLASQSRPA